MKDAEKKKMGVTKKMEWTEKAVDMLRSLWTEGLSTAEIGRRLNITKNAVVGKARRLGLPTRPSPIQPRDQKESRPATARKTGNPAKTERTERGISQAGQTEKAFPGGKAKAAETSGEAKLEPVTPAPAESPACEAPAGGVGGGEAPKKGVRNRKKKAAETAASSPGPEKKAVRKKPKSEREEEKRTPRRGPGCQWPEGDPGTPGFSFCGRPAVPSKPYCPEHCEIAYVRLSDRRS